MDGMSAVKTVLILLFASAYGANGEDDKRYSAESNKVAGLFPFPRVGRAGGGGRLVWSLEAPTDHMAVKRQGLFSFPRVGRSGRPRLLPAATLMFATPSRGTAVGTPMIAREIGYGDVTKRNGGEVAGMWFGPRLGKRDKRNAESLPWTFIALKEFPVSRHREGFAPHLGRDSNEDSGDFGVDDEEEVDSLIPLGTRFIDKTDNKSQQTV